MSRNLLRDDVSRVTGNIRANVFGGDSMLNYRMGLDSFAQKVSYLWLTTAEHHNMRLSAFRGFV